MKKSEIVNRNKVQRGYDKIVISINNVTQDVPQGYLAFGFKIKEIYTNYYIDKIILDVTYKSNDALDTTPEIGIGTTKATGAVSNLSGTATFTDVVESMTGEAFNGTNLVHMQPIEYVAKDIQPPQVFLSGSLYLNVAGAWGAISTLTFNAKIIIFWCPIN